MYNGCGSLEVIRDLETVGPHIRAVGVRKCRESGRAIGIYPLFQ